MGPARECRSEVLQLPDGLYRYRRVLRWGGAVRLPAVRRGGLHCDMLLGLPAGLHLRLLRPVIPRIVPNPLRIYYV